MRFLISLCLKALAFLFLLPMIPGIGLHANFGVALALALFFSVMQWIVELVAMALTAYLTISTLGVGLLVLIPIWLLGFWLMPSIALKLVSDFMPEYLAVHGWTPAILGGLLLFFVNLVSSSLTDVRNSIKS